MNIQILLIAFLGVVIHWLYKLIPAYAKPDFDIRKFLKDNLVGIALSFVTTFALVLCLPAIQEYFFPVFQASLVALLIGISGSSLIRNLLKIKK